MATMSDHYFLRKKMTLQKLINDICQKPTSSSTQPEVRNTTNKLQCEHCGKQFTTTTNLDNHVRVHTREKPFTCPYCDKGFSQSSNLTTHIKKRHEGKEYRVLKRKMQGQTREPRPSLQSNPPPPEKDSTSDDDDKDESVISPPIFAPPSPTPTTPHPKLPKPKPGMAYIAVKTGICGEEIYPEFASACMDNTILNLDVTRSWEEVFRTEFGLVIAPQQYFMQGLDMTGPKHRMEESVYVLLAGSKRRPGQPYNVTIIDIEKHKAFMLARRAQLG